MEQEFRWCPKRRKGGDIAQAGQRIPVGSCYRGMTYDPCKRKYRCEFYDVAIAKEATARRRIERAEKTVEKVLEPAQKIESKPQQENGRDLVHYWKPGIEPVKINSPIVHYGLEDKTGTLCGLVKGTTKTCQKPEDFKLCKRCEARS